MRVLLLIVALSSCVTDKYRPHTTEWNDNDDDTVVRAAPPPPSGPKTVTARDLADASRSARECNEKARTHYEKDRSAGLALLKACVGRPDFTELDWLLERPWSAALQNEQSLQLMIAEVIGRRGGFVERELFSVRAAGIPIYDVNSALALGDSVVGKLVLVRGAVTRVEKEKWGTATSNVATIAESSWADVIIDENRPPEARDELEPKTGRNVFARVADKGDRFPLNKQLVFALQHEGKRAHKDDQSDGDVQSVIGILVEGYDAAPSLAP